MNFTILDWLFVTLFIIITILAGLWTKRRISNYDFYLPAFLSKRTYVNNS